MISCSQQKGQMKYLLSKRNSGEIDTIYTEILSRQSNDAVEIIKYRFDSRLKDSPAYEQEFILPKRLDSVPLNNVSYVYKKTFAFEGKEYTVSKYQYDLLESSDEESLYFYTPEFGIILFHWGTHRNSQRLIQTGNNKNDRVIYYLTDKIESDHLLTKSW